MKIINKYGDDGKKYRIVMYVMGHIIETRDNMTLDEARQYYADNYSDNCALKLYVDDKPISYLHVHDVLKISKKEKLYYHK